MSTPTTADPPAWLEAAAKLEAVAGDDVPLAEENAAAEELRSEPDARARGKLKTLASASGSERSVLPAAKSRITPPLVVPSVRPAAEEVELAWHGYSATALMPSTFALAVVTWAAIVILRPLVPTAVLHEAADVPLAALWLLQAFRAGYRLFGYNYRLTTRRLFRERGELYPPEAPLDLATVVRAESCQSLFGRLAGVGTVRVIPENAAEAVELAGVRRPKVLAARIEEAATAAREANVTVGRMPGEPGGVSPRSV